MLYSRMVTAALVAGLFPSGTAQAEDREPPSAFSQPAEPDAVLADSYGGSRRDADGFRALVDPEALGYLQQVGRSSGIAMDNWWAQTGAALIDNNLLAAR